MPYTYYPQAIILLSDIPASHMWLHQKPVAWPSTAIQWNAEGGSSYDGGRFIDDKGQLEGHGVPLRQDTYLSTGSSGPRTGRAFRPIAGLWRDNYASGQYSTYGLEQPTFAESPYQYWDDTLGQYVTVDRWEVQSEESTDAIEACEIVLRRSFPPATATSSEGIQIGSGSSAHNRQNTYTYLYFAWQGTSAGETDPENVGPDPDPDTPFQDYRIALEYGQPIRLDYTTDGWVTYQPVSVARDLGSVERYLKTHNNEIRITVKPDFEDGTFHVEIGDGYWLRHAPDESIVANLLGRVPASNAELLPFPGNLRLLGRNGWCTFEYYPHRHQALGIIKSKRSMDMPIPNAKNAYLVGNALTRTHPDQTMFANIDTDGQTFQWQVEASLPDAGEGFGSALPPRVTDVTLIVPPVWTNSVDGYFDSHIDYVAGIQVQEIKVFDDATRTFSTSALITANNQNYDYTGTFGNRAISLYASSDGATFYPRLNGVAGAGEQGFSLYHKDPVRLLAIPCHDAAIKMQTPLCDEFIADGWALPSAVRFLGEKGNIHPMWMQTIPYWPYGPADAGCPYEVLPRGTGRSPKFRFGPELSVWQCLQMLVQQSGKVINPFTQTVWPYYMGFTNEGQFLFEPYNPLVAPPVIHYQDEDPTGIGQIQEITVYNSVAQMRTGLDFQGLDAWTYELLWKHVEMPPQVLKAIGFRYDWLDRSPQYASQEYLDKITAVAAQHASLPSQVVRLKVPFQPWVNAGDLVVISDRVTLGGTGTYYVIEIQSTYGLADVTGRSGKQEACSYVTCRSTADLAALF